MVDLLHFNNKYPDFTAVQYTKERLFFACMKKPKKIADSVDSKANYM